MLRELRTFLAVAAAGSIQGAARNLPMTQSAATRQIQRLEAELGCMLLDRRAKPPRLTREGEQARAQGKLLLEQVEAFRARFDPGGEPSGLLRLGVAHAALDWRGGRAVAQAVAELSAACPRVAARVSAGWTPRLLAELQGGGLDAAVVIGRAEAAWPSGVAVLPLARDRLVAVGARSLGVTARTPLYALFERPWILNPDGCGYRALLTALATANGSSVRIGAEVQGASLQRELVAAGLGVGLVPEGVAQDWRGMVQRGSDLVVVRLEEASFEVTAALAYAAGPRMLRPIEAIGGSLSRSLARLPPRRRM